MSASILRASFWSGFIPVLAMRRFAGRLCILPSVAAMSTSNVACSIGERRAHAKRKSASLLSGSMVGCWRIYGAGSGSASLCIRLSSGTASRCAPCARAFAAQLAAAGLTTRHAAHILRHTAATWAMQNGADLWQTAGFLGMTVEMLDRVYGHHHPDHQADAAAAIGGRKLRRQDGDRTGVNKPRQTQTNATKIAVVSRGAQIKHSVRDVGVAGSNPATPTSSTLKRLN